MKTLNNTVIKNLSPEMGKEIIKKYQADGWDTGVIDGTSCVERGKVHIYYGVIDNHFSFYKLEGVQSANARIIELDYEPEFSPKRGDMVLVWDKYESMVEKRIYLVAIEGAKIPIRTVADGYEEMFMGGNKFHTEGWKNMKPIPTEQPKPERDIKAEIRAAFNDMNRLIEEL